ncbi:MAG: N-acetylmuramoyl-L-alanine amidase [Phycisphaerae bacterium]|nr:N-acetylmuramoyl-L-alanine amidase [Phycisphaerae bacterium]
MTEQARTSRVLIGLIVSMTIGAVVLMALDKGAVQGGPFSLAAYLSNDSVDKVAFEGLTSSPGQWRRIEVYYSQTTRGNVQELETLNRLSKGHDLNAHFVICNGQGGKEGEIERTNRWLLQQPCLPGDTWSGSMDTIRICVVADGVGQMPTECQMARSRELVKTLCKEARINRNMVAWPANWRM